MTKKLKPTTKVFPTWVGTDDYYDGAELRPFTGRAGAMDAYRLKSLCGAMSMHERAHLSLHSPQPSTPAVEVPRPVEDI